MPFAGEYMLRPGLEDVIEYCLATDPFQARCLKNEIIVMNSAVYGRMKIGQCLQDHDSLLQAHFNDPLFLGCSVDVLSMMDIKCSGLNQCEVHGTDIGLRQAKPCYASLMKYMEASYECVTGITIRYSSSFL